ncbi:serine/arginine repetitive matrix protein 1-like [Pezoporus wallicus]|uniref:serine/arginine repetitive matrix protein 1-like n=1 Tax=Pezoporus wallicus TaxID=35540 RepID=UPI002551B542|nr:serine/arginine repetitive matrix protein 1-like [Pezoporus wallicus]
MVQKAPLSSRESEGLFSAGGGRGSGSSAPRRSPAPQRARRAPETSSARRPEEEEEEEEEKEEERAPGLRSPAPSPRRGARADITSAVTPIHAPNRSLPAAGRGWSGGTPSQGEGRVLPTATCPTRCRPPPPPRGRPGPPRWDSGQPAESGGEERVQYTHTPGGVRLRPHFLCRVRGSALRDPAAEAPAPSRRGGSSLPRPVQPFARAMLSRRPGAVC